MINSLAQREAFKRPRMLLALLAAAAAAAILAACSSGTSSSGGSVPGSGRCNDGRRRVVSFGLHYDFAERRVRDAAELPAFLLPLRDRAAGFAGLTAAALEHALVTEYTPGAAIGWHRDRPVFGDVIGISFGSSCRFRFRRALPDTPPQAAEGRVGARRGSGWERASLLLEPRSAYLLRGPARHQWEHSIPPAEDLRYSVTFRSVKLPVASAGR